MNQIQEWKTRIEEINAAVLTLEQEKRKLEQCIAETACPYKSGDIIVITERRNTGRWHVMRVEPSWSSWKVVAVKFNKDGETGKLIRDFTRYDNISLEDVTT